VNCGQGQTTDHDGRPDFELELLIHRDFLVLNLDANTGILDWTLGVCQCQNVFHGVKRPKRDSRGRSG
jgi:hypothetical protein